MAMLRIKKMFVSSVGNSKLGREEVHKRLGEEAQTIVDAMISCTEKFAGEELADSFNKDLIKLVLKVGFMWQEKLLSESDIEPARDSTTSLAQTLLEYLSRGTGGVDGTDVCHMIHEVKDAVIPIVQPHMTEKNWTKIGTLAGFYGSPEFASFFLNDPDVADEREAFLGVLQTQLPETARRQVCSVVGCFLPRCTMPGTLYCFPHHSVKFQVAPTVDDFLRNSHYSALFRQWVVSHAPELKLVLEFFFKADDYGEVRSRATLASRAPTLWRKYLAPTAAHRVPLGDWLGDGELAVIVGDIEGALAASAPPKSTLFVPAQGRAHAVLSEAFEGPFKASEAYAAWADENMGLPLPQVPAARAALLEQLGIPVEAAYGVVGTGGGTGSVSTQSGGAAAATGAGGGVPLTAAPTAVSAPVADAGAAPAEEARPPVAPAE